jgi:alkanesulfonate monooxygenase SsuD/methylene tetrahydromethanopterin reductase-like flavin-dependent oxidoreductase (luciferase family)
MAEHFQFGLVVRGQAEPGEDIARRFEATLRFVREADRLGFDSLTKTAHYSAHPFQMLQLVPMLARFTAEAPRLRLNAGVVLLPLLSPLHVAEEFATLDVMSGGISSWGSGSVIAMLSSRHLACPVASEPAVSRTILSRCAGCGPRTRSR